MFFDEIALLAMIYEDKHIGQVKCTLASKTQTFPFRFESKNELTILRKTTATKQLKLKSNEFNSTITAMTQC